jgi:hypothetical protein
MDVATHERVAKFRGARTPVKSDNTFMPLLFTRTLRLKVRGEAYSWLNAAAVEVNEVFNYCNGTSLKAATRTDLKRKWMSGFDLCNLTAGAIHLFVDTRTALASQLARALPRIRPDAAIWVSWPKKASGIATDVSDNVIRAVALPMGLVDIKVCAVDDTWSGLKLVIRKENRRKD